MYEIDYSLAWKLGTSCLTVILYFQRIYVLFLISTVKMVTTEFRLTVASPGVRGWGRAAKLRGSAPRS